MIFGEHDEQTIAQFNKAATYESASGAVLCADGHYGYAHPIGGVVGYTDHISVSGVGFDIACGNMAVRLDVKREELTQDVDLLLKYIASHVSFGMGRSNNERVDHPLFGMNSKWERANALSLRKLAHEQLGTVGSGNHYVDLLTDQEGFVWIGVHFGSRGLGHKITTQALKNIGAKDSMDADPALIELGTDLADEYLAGMELAGLYAYAGREWVVEKVRSIVGGEVTFTVHNHHNFAWQERHFGKNMWVVRKGATPAFPGQFGFVGGSMGDNAVILKGVDSDLSRNAMYSTVHGAGRTMSRTQARGKINRKTGAIVKPGAVRHDEWRKWLDDFGVTVLGGDLDESPQAYRRLTDVLEYHKGTVSIEHVLRPFGVIMAGSDTIDPYKD
jgi:tRNA-splicing ligase RtcB (3'-phosphate/5'-hydroxy nucleic acid ligase)